MKRETAFVHPGSREHLIFIVRDAFLRALRQELPEDQDMDEKDLAGALVMALLEFMPRKRVLDLLRGQIDLLEEAERNPWPGTF